MKIGLIDVDSHNFPNLCLMKLSAYHKAKGHTVEWWNAKGRYDLVYKSRVFTDTYSKDTITVTNAEQVIFGGTGYDTKNRLLPEVEHSYPDYSIYPQFFGIAYGFLSRGCPRNCGFCIVSSKEGRESVKVADLSEFWKWQPEIKIMDANLLACPDHENLIEQLIRSRAWVDFSQGLDGFTAKQTLDYAQALYEKRLLTYPRTDSKYITSDMQDSTKELITGLCSLLPFMRDVKLQADLIRVCDNSKVTDHHAILPTAEFLKAGFASLADSETKLMTLVCAKLLCAAAAPYAYEAVTAVFTCGGYTFTAKGRTTLCEGWREIERLSRAASEEQDEDAEPEAVLPPLTEGQTFENTAAEISERYTQPPKAYTEDTLLSAMENAGKEETPEDAERKGLGTTATRAGIIEKLISAGFAERKGKKLIPTKDGYNLVAILPESLTSPQLTAEWETRLTGIAKGSDSPADFMRGIEEMTAGLVKTYSAISEDKAKLFTPQREAIGTCPRCGAAVYEGKKNYYCSDRACSFVMWKNDLFFQQRKKTFTKAIAAALLKDGKVKIKGMYSTKTGKTFDGVVLLADTGGKYVNFRVEQNRK